MPPLPSNQLIQSCSNNPAASGIQELMTAAAIQAAVSAGSGSTLNTTSMLRLGNHDWTSLLTPSNANVSAIYDNANQGVRITTTAGNAGFMTISTATPINPNAVYKCTIKLKSLTTDSNTVISLGAISLDNNLAEINTDAVDNNFIVSGNIQTRTIGVYTFSGSIQGYNITSGVDLNKFDPEANYFKLKLTTDHLPANTHEVVIQSIVLEQLAYDLEVQHDVIVGHNINASNLKLKPLNVNGSWDPSYALIFSGNNKVIASDTIGNMHITHNCYFDGINWRYNLTDMATRTTYTDLGTTDITSAISGTAGSIITWIHDVSIKSPGKLYIGDALIINNGLPITDITGNILAPGLDNLVPTEKAVYDYVLANTAPITHVHDNRYFNKVATGDSLLSNGILIEGIFHAGGIKSSRIMWDETNGDHLNGLSLQLAGVSDNSLFPSGAFKETTAGAWSLRMHNGNIDGIPIMSGLNNNPLLHINYGVTIDSGNLKLNPTSAAVNNINAGSLSQLATNNLATEAAIVAYTDNLVIGALTSYATQVYVDNKRSLHSITSVGNGSTITWTGDIVTIQHSQNSRYFVFNIWDSVTNETYLVDCVDRQLNLAKFDFIGLKNQLGNITYCEMIF